ncbi:J domain-containing protein [Pantoea endophytica]|uniref:J domain-containing protein n=1 Tax=Pantoea sp. BJ2 TaxID=3141322 RepID=A0AAU7U565_9GAMM
MNIQQALNILGLTGELSVDDVKKAYRKLANKYHPDKNSFNVELMKAINTAKDYLMDNLDKINSFQSLNQDEQYNFTEELAEILAQLNNLNGIVFEVIGNWVWISGNTKEHKDKLNELSCKWAPKKKMWFYRPEEHKSLWNRSEKTLEDIREAYGTSGKFKTKGAYRVSNQA